MLFLAMFHPFFFIIPSDWVQNRSKVNIHAVADLTVRGLSGHGGPVNLGAPWMVIPAHTTVCTVVSSRTSVPNRGLMDEKSHTWCLVLGV